jgi:hypothetical protein
VEKAGIYESIAITAIPFKITDEFIFSRPVGDHLEGKKERHTIAPERLRRNSPMDTQVDQYREGLFHKVGAEIFINNWQCFLGHNDSKGRLLD